MCEEWGLLGPETVSAPRRTRGLGLGACVRKFNDLAVPGLGNVWFCKQLVLALLGVAVAENARARGKSVRNIEVANSVEALACWQAFRENGWQGDRRLRGRIKLQGREDILFKEARKRSFYVTQPLRMSTVQPLPALGLVEASSSRFNSFRCTRAARELLDAATGGNRGGPDRDGILWDHEKWCARNPVVRDLTRWVVDEGSAPGGGPLRMTLSPRTPLAAPAQLRLRRLLTTGDSDAARRRGDALAWVARLKANNDFRWGERPPEITGEAHWRDLEAGARFFALRDAAIAVLDAVEGRLGARAKPELTPEEAAAALPDELATLESAAQHCPALHEVDAEAGTFARECRGDPAATVRALVERDGQVLRLRDGEIVPGPAFRGKQARGGGEDAEDSGEEGAPELSASLLPEHVSVRILNLWWLERDLARKDGIGPLLEQGAAK